MSRRRQEARKQEINKHIEQPLNLPEQIPADLRAALSSKTPAEQKRILSTLATLKITQTTYAGPLPDPDTLERYAHIIPNGADRIMQAMEKQSDHRMRCDHRMINQGNRGQVFGFIFGLISLTATYFLAIAEHESVAIVVGGTSLVTFGGSLLSVLKDQKKDSSK